MSEYFHLSRFSIVTFFLKLNLSFKGIFGMRLSCYCFILSSIAFLSACGGGGGSEGSTQDELGIVGPQLEIFTAPAPEIFSKAPAYIPSTGFDYTAEISGVGLTGATNLTVNGILATIISQSESQVRFTAPGIGAPGSYTLSVDVNGTTLQSDIDYSAPVLNISSIETKFRNTYFLMSNGALNLTGTSGLITSYAGFDGQTIENSVLDLAIGDNHSCAVLGDNTVKCWGANYYGQIGMGLSGQADGEYSFPTPTAVLGIDGSTNVATKVAVENQTTTGHSCAVVNQGVVCWGRNNSGQLGNSSSGSSPVPSFVQVTGLDGVSANVVDVTAGKAHSCALLDTGEVRCWGDGVDGQLGNGSTADVSTPTQVSGIDGTNIKATAIASYENHSCALIDSGAVKCWGANDFGELGQATFMASSSSTPIDVDGIDGTNAKATAISVSANSSCASLVSGAVF